MSFNLEKNQDVEDCWRFVLTFDRLWFDDGKKVQSHFLDFVCFCKALSGDIQFTFGTYHKYNEAVPISRTAHFIPDRKSQYYSK